MRKLILSLTFMLVAVLGYSQNITYKKDAFGNTAVYDSRGYKVGTYKKDAFGNTVLVRE